MANDIDFIKRAVAYKKEGHTFKELHEKYRISSATYYYWVNKLENDYFYKNEKTIKQKRHRKIDMKDLKKAIIENPDAPLKEYAKQFNCTPTAIHYALDDLKITRKKGRLHIPRNPCKSRRSL
jgi:transposase